MHIHIPDVVQNQFVFEVTGLHSDIHSLLAFSVISGEQLNSAETASS